MTTGASNQQSSTEKEKGHICKQHDKIKMNKPKVRKAKEIRPENDLSTYQQVTNT